MTTTVTIKNQAPPVYSDGKPNKHVVKIKVYNKGSNHPQEAEIGPGESFSGYVYENQEIVLSESKIE